jgi:hypothetical protein
MSAPTYRWPVVKAIAFIAAAASLGLIPLGLIRLPSESAED